MFDSVVCKYALPMPEEPKGYINSIEFQTKDLENGLLHYEIREDGSLWLEEHEYEHVPGDPKAKFFLDRIGRMKSIRSWFTQQKITKTIEIYDYMETSGQYDYWISYDITFIDGYIKHVNLKEFRATDNTERKERNRQFDLEMRQDYEFRKTKRYRYIYKHYNGLVRFLFSRLNKVLNFAGSRIWKLERKLLI